MIFLFFNKIKKNILYILPIIILFFWFLFLLKDNFYAKFWIIDDHEIIFYSKSDKNLFFLYSDIIKEDLINNQRFRPTYWLIKVLEFKLFDNNPFIYYISHFLILFIGFVFLYLIFFLLFKKNYIFSLLLIFLISIQEFWSNLYTQLAPAEKYGFFYSSIWFYLLIKFFLEKKIKNIHLIFFVIFSILTSLVKENFFIFLIVSIFTIFYLHKTNKISNKKFIYVNIVLFLFLVVSIIFFLKIKNNKFDVYSRPTSFIYRLIINNKKLDEIYKNSGINEIIFILIPFYIFLLKNKKIYLLKNIFFNLFFLIFLFSLIYYQYFINFGEFLNFRYHFPMMVLKYYFLPIFYFINIKDIKDRQKYIINTIIVLFLIFKIFNNIKEISIIKKSVLNNRLRTNKFYNDLITIKQYYKKISYKKFYLIFDYTVPLNIEFLHSIEKYLNFYNLKFDLYVIMPENCYEDNFNKLENRLCLDVLNRIDNDKKIVNKNKIVYKKYENNINKTNNCVLFYLDPYWKNIINCNYEFNYNDYIVINN